MRDFLSERDGNDDLFFLLDVALAYGVGPTSCFALRTVLPHLIDTRFPPCPRHDRFAIGASAAVAAILAYLAYKFFL